MNKKFILFSFIQIFSFQIFAHGEDKPGPHGGYIRMPGAFHTEVLKDKEGYRVYLLDMNWEKPTTVDSSVNVVIKTGKKKVEIKCTAEKDSFLCKTKLKEKGELQLTAKREGQMGNETVYKLPLKFEKLNTSHEGHH